MSDFLDRFAAAIEGASGTPPLTARAIVEGGEPQATTGEALAEILLLLRGVLAAVEILGIEVDHIRTILRIEDE